MSPAGVAEAHDWPQDQLWVRALMLATADGAARADTGLSGDISSAGDRLLFATIRGMADVILVGAETIRQEGYSGMKARPELAARRARAGQADAPRVAIVTRSGDLDPDAAIFQDSQLPPIVFLPESVAVDRRDRLSQVCEVVPLGTDEVPLGEALGYLDSIGLKRVVCEGGPSILGALAALDLVDEICLTVTPLLSGGRYSNGERTPRILDGAALPESPRPMRLIHVLEDSGSLFLRYAVHAHSDPDDSAPVASSERAPKPA